MKIANCKLEILSSIFKKICFLFLVLVVSGGLFYGLISAQEIDTNAVTDHRARLEAELALLETQIEAQRTVIRQKQMESTTFERDIAILDAQISKARLEIRMRNITIDNLNTGITEKTGFISVLEKKTGTQKISLAGLLREVNEMDSTSLVEIVLGYDTLSDFFDDFSSFESIQKELKVSLDDIKNTQERTTEEKTSLETKKSEELELRHIQELEKGRLEQRESEKQNLLKITKGEEARYQEILTKNQKTAAAIRSELFLLRGSPAIPFEKAVEYANIAWRATGVRPAFLLAIITQETNLGANIGQCNLPDDPPQYKWQSIMPGPEHYRNYVNNGNSCVGAKSPCSYRDDQTIFVSITQKLGTDPNMMPLSCPQAGGWGGAMGPAQFIPDTWRRMESKIAQLTGHNPPDPWDPYDAFMASALLLKDNGAAAGGYTAERTAALRYFAGGNWNKPAYAFYGDDVMEIAAKYQKQIDIISN